MEFPCFMQLEVPNKYFKFAPRGKWESSSVSIRICSPATSTSDWFYLKRKSLAGWINQYSIIKHDGKAPRGRRRPEKSFSLTRVSVNNRRTGKCENKSNGLRQKLFCIFRRRVDCGPEIGQAGETFIKLEGKPFSFLPLLLVVCQARGETNMWARGSEEKTTTLPFLSSHGLLSPFPLESVRQISIPRH